MRRIGTVTLAVVMAANISAASLINPPSTLIGDLLPPLIQADTQRKEAQRTHRTCVSRAVNRRKDSVDTLINETVRTTVKDLTDTLLSSGVCLAASWKASLVTGPVAGTIVVGCWGIVVGRGLIEITEVSGNWQIATTSIETTFQRDLGYCDADLLKKLYRPKN